MSLKEYKKALRERAMACRRAANRAAGPETADALWRNLRGPLASAADDAPISAFWPIGDEIDIRPILDRLQAAGRVLCLPVVVGPGIPLIFRRWRLGEALGEGPMGTRMPLPAAEEIAPTFLLTPLLAFDRRGRRLGYGGGFYDRTLRGLRARGTVTAVGIAYAAQEVDTVPTGPDDETLDWVVTEKEAIRI